jgi:hypothetical protein
MVHLTRRKDLTSAETALWTLVAILVPVVGPVVYFLAGRQRHNPPETVASPSGRPGR